jgi:hypothetical protein
MKEREDMVWGYIRVKQKQLDKAVERLTKAVNESLDLKDGQKKQIVKD